MKCEQHLADGGVAGGECCKVEGCKVEGCKVEGKHFRDQFWFKPIAWFIILTLDADAGIELISIPASAPA